MFFEDGAGSGKKAKVDDNNRLTTSSVIKTSADEAISVGDAYNINSGSVSLTAAGTLLYIKNNEDQDMVVEAVAVGIGEGSFSDTPEITFFRNGNAGDLITDETPVAMNQNRNHGSSRTLTADTFAGKSGGVITGGQDELFIYQGTGRLYATINIVLPKGSSLAIKIDPKLSSGTVKAYAAFIVHLKEGTTS